MTTRYTNPRLPLPFTCFGIIRSTCHEEGNHTPAMPITRLQIFATFSHLLAKLCGEPRRFKDNHSQIVTISVRSPPQSHLDNQSQCY